MSARKLANLVAGLPLGCALHRAQDPDAVEWRYTEELLATLIEVLDRHDRHFVLAHTKKGARAPKPIEILRPHDRRKGPKRAATGEELAKLVGMTGGATVGSPKGGAANGRD